MKRAVTFMTMLSFMFLFFNNNVDVARIEAKTYNKSVSKKDTLYFYQFGDYALTTCTIIDVYLKDTENYKKSGSNVIYTDRHVYAYADVVSDWVGGHIDFKVFPTCYKDNNNKVVKTFDYKTESNIFPTTDFFMVQ